MKLFYVYKIEYCEYSEDKGLIVQSTDWKRAKGIAMASWGNQDRNNIIVQELESEEGIICATDNCNINKKYN